MRFELSRKFGKRFKKFLKALKFDFYFKSNVAKRGLKKMLILLIYIFAWIDRMNMNFENDLALPTQQQIADLANCHVSWVKQVKVEYFTKLTNDEFDQLRKHFGIQFCWETVKSWKDINQFEQSDHHNCYCDHNPQAQTPFVTKTKCYVNFYKIKNSTKVICYFKFFKYTTFDFSQDPQLSRIRNKKTNKVKSNLIVSMFQKAKLWKNQSWLWKVLYWFQTTFEIDWKNAKRPENGVIANWF